MNRTTAPDIRKTDQLFDCAMPVKAGAIREVRRTEEFYIKLDKRKNHSFKSEFDRAIQLQKAGIPVTDPIFYTTTEKGSFLVTGAFEGISLEEYLKNHSPGKDFYFMAADLLKKMLKKGFIHTDFHLGNLLYSEKENRFVLVDVDGIKKIPPFLVPLVPEYIRFHLLTEFRSHLNKEEMSALFRSAGVKSPEKFYSRLFIRNAGKIRHSWARRKKQILSGYPKFTVPDNDTLTDRDNAGKKCEELPLDNGRNLFLAHFYLKLIRVPHRELQTLDLKNDRVTAVAADHDQPEKTAAEEMIARLQFYGIDTTISDWRKGNGNLPELYSLEKVAASPLISQTTE